MKINQLTFTRFLAAISIVIFHAHQTVYPFKIGILSTIFSHANVGVSYFFILSGFVMIIAYAKNKSDKIVVGNYYLNRVARIYPVYLLALVLTVITRLRNDEIHFIGLSLHTLALQAWVPSEALKLNSPGWSLSVEALFYLAFPLIFNFFYNKYSFKSTLIVVLSLWAITQVAVNYLNYYSLYEANASNSHDFIYYFPLWHINEFLVGNCLGYLYLKNVNKAKNYDLLVTFIFLLLLVTLSFNIPINYHDGLMAIIFVPLIFFMSLNNGKISQLFSNKYLIILGEASYGMYILQVPLQCYCNLILKKMPFIDTNWTFYIYLIVLIISSVFCYYLIEIPAKNWIKSFKKNSNKKAKPALVEDSVNF